MTAARMFEIFEEAISQYHQFDDVDTPIQNPYGKDSFESTLYKKNWIDTVQWHLEDIIRNPEINPVEALKLKRRIDSSNQERTDMVEKIDDFYEKTFSGVKPTGDARLNTESPAWAIDRLSILALKIYHMQLEAQRHDIEEGLKEKNNFKYEILLTQKADLTLAIDQFLEDLQNGNRIMKIYRQMKMYNDPELNPVLYSQKKS